MLVTGGAGFIGSNFIRRFLDANPACRLINLDLLTYAGNLKNLTTVEQLPNYRFVKGDIADAALVASILAEEKVDAVLHFAAESHVDRSISGPEIFVRTNVLGTQVLLEESRKHWQSGTVKDFRFYQISTDEVYGSLGASGYFTEETPLAANSPYSASKAGIGTEAPENPAIPLIGSRVLLDGVSERRDEVAVGVRASQAALGNQPGYQGFDIPGRKEL